MKGPLVSSLLLIATATHAAPASQFVGLWTRVDAPVVTLDIAPNGENYIVDYKHSGARQKKGKYVAIYKNGTLMVDRGVNKFVMDIDQKTGLLIYDTKEFRRSDAAK